MAAEGFLNRWSRLKRDANGAALPPTEEAARPGPQSPSELLERRKGADAAALQDAPAVTPAASAEQAAAEPGRGDTQRARADGARAAQADDFRRTLPSLDDLGFDSDYAPFMRPDVDPGMRMSALKKLFADPHFNRMDGLDVYIDDYSKPDPIPRAMLARLNQSRLLGLFEEEEEKPAGAVADGAGASPAGAEAGAEAAADDAADDATDDGGVAGKPQVAAADPEASSGEVPADATANAIAPAPLDPASDRSSDSPPDSRQAT